MVVLKQALDYEQQVDRLIEFHKLNIDDRSKAIAILKKVNYYRLSAYGIGLKKKDNPEEYTEGTSLSSIYKLYSFDSSFKNLLIHIIEQIEIQLRTQISNHLALKYGPEGYMDPTVFISKTAKDGTDVYSNIIEHFIEERNRQKNIPFVKHHMNKYAGHFPIWVAVELFTFGNLSSMYSIMRDIDRQAIASLYNTEPSHLQSWILALIEVRNICAHYGRLYNMPLKQTPYLYSEFRKYRNGKLNKVFPVILSIKRILADNTDLWDQFNNDLSVLMDRNRDVIQLSYIGFPNDWKYVLSQ